MRTPLNDASMYEGIDTVVLQDELAIEDDLPFAWQPQSLPLPMVVQNRYAESNARVLQVCMALDDPSTTEKTEDSPQATELARLDLKMNLMLDLVGRLLLQNQPRPMPAKLRFNARGALWRAQDSSLQVQLSETGVFEVYLQNCLVDPLRLTGRVARLERGNVEICFDRGPEAIANLIDKLTFRRHRRRVADARKR